MALGASPQAPEMGTDQAQKSPGRCEPQGLRLEGTHGTAKTGLEEKRLKGEACLNPRCSASAGALPLLCRLPSPCPPLPK